MRKPFLSVFVSLATICSSLFATDPVWQKEVRPILAKYCVACHNKADKEGGLSLETYAEALSGGKHGAVLAPGRPKASRLITTLTGKAKPAMPPVGNEGPTADEVATLQAWVLAGARGPEGKEPALNDLLKPPTIKPTAHVAPAVQAAAISSTGNAAFVQSTKAVISFGESITDTKTITDIPRAPNAAVFSPDGSLLVIGGGEPGVQGEARVYETKSGKLVRTITGHRDGLYAVAISPNAKLLATGSYDKTAAIWNLQTGEQLHFLQGHNGPIFAADFRADSKVLATCSGDSTVKLWNVATGDRLDTLNEAAKELYTIAFHPNGELLTAGGVGQVIHQWRISDEAKEGTNPLVVSRFAHQGALLRLAYSGRGDLLLSSSEDRAVKIWSGDTLTLLRSIANQSDWVTGLAVSTDAKSYIVGRLDGTHESAPIQLPETNALAAATPLAETPPLVDYGEQPAASDLPKVAETEPNNTPINARSLTLPTIATGTINARQAADEDLFRFAAKQGDQWIMEINAARIKSPLDSRLEVLHADGSKVTRLVLRATRNSELTFRGMNSDQRGARLLHWEEISLNDFIYLDGEVVKQFQQRRGPDADAQFYPEGGNRHSYFDTSAKSYPLGQPAYVVTPYPAGVKLPDNGLPIFPLYFENDDDASRRLGSDSRLHFTAPRDGEYFIRVSDVRNFSGPDFRYELTVRRPQPDFSVRATPDKLTVNRGGAKKITFTANRIDDFNGPIVVTVSNLPPGFFIDSPITIEAGHRVAHASLFALPTAKEPTTEQLAAVKIIATAPMFNKDVVRSVAPPKEWKVADKAKLLVRLSRPGEPPPTIESGDEIAIPEITIVPGKRTRCQLSIERNGFENLLKFDINNLPHGVIVDDIGLSGVMIPKGATERTLFLAAEDWVPETVRTFHAVGLAEGNQASFPLKIRVLPTTK